jgi:anaerobic selenocysteine-containing dehydrogenase
MSDVASQQRIHGYCALCTARCGSIAVVEHGRFIRLEPDPAHPTGQALCAKGRAAVRKAILIPAGNASPGTRHWK